MKIRSVILLSSFFVFAACEYRKNDAPKTPEPTHVPVVTKDLEVAYVNTETVDVNSPIWQEIDYIAPEISDFITKKTDTDPKVLNTSGTYNGIVDFNKGDSINLKLRAIYNTEYLYILAEWNDNYANTSSKTRTFDGPHDPLQLTKDTTGWTSQLSSDNFYMTFSDAEQGVKDIWNWNAALSAPLGYAIDKHINTDGDTVSDSGTEMYMRNSVDGTNASRPKYEWSGNLQNVTYSPQKTLAIDPAYYLLDTVAFIGNAGNGSVIFDNECSHCHGYAGTGVGPDAYAVNLNNTVFNNYTRKAIVEAGLSESHDGKSHFEKLNASDKDDLLAYLRGIAGVPGYVLQLPTESAADVTAVTTFNTFKVKPSNNGTYKVLFKRKLNTGYTDDISFSPSNQIQLSVHISDNDEINRIGAEGILVIFKTTETDKTE